MFGTTEAYLIEDGRITEPLRDANLIGNGPEVLEPDRRRGRRLRHVPRARAARTGSRSPWVAASRRCG